MRISVTKGSGVAIVDQIATQIMLAIISGELHPEQRLPSIRALATRLHVHSNSVRAAYLSLEQRSWVELRRGSGVYVTNSTVASGTAMLVRTFVESARALGMSDDAIRSAVDQALATQQTESVLVFEPEPELRKVLIAEIAEAVKLRVEGTDGDGDPDPALRVLVVALAARAAAQTSYAPALWLNVNSATGLLQKQQPPPSHSLVTFVSRSPDLRRIARAVLMAAGWNAEALELKDPSVPGWKRGLRSSALIIADTIAMREIPAGIEVKRLRVISESSLEEIRKRCVTASEVF